MSWNPDDSGSDSDEEDELAQIKGREAFIFVIDAALFANYARFEDCLSCVRDALLSAILCRGRDLIGVVFNNTKYSPPPKDVSGMENIVPHQNTAVFIPLRDLCKETVDYYLNFVEPDHFDFGNKYGITTGSFSNMIWLCTNMFQQSGFKLSTSNIIYFTELPSPHDVASNDFQQAIRKAKDLREINVDFSVVPMIDEFDYNPFYKEFFCTVRNIELDAFVPDVPSKCRAIVRNGMIRRNFQTRCTTHLQWKIGDGIQLAVGIYNFYARDVYPHSIKMLREDNSVVEVKHTYKLAPIYGDDVSGEERICLPSEQRKTITIGGDTINFTNEEVHQMRCPMAPGIRLIGFKPRTTVDQHQFLKSAAYLYPNEERLTGSTKLFRALWEKCLEKNKVALCVLVTKRNAGPQYVALIPTEKNDSEFQKTVSGEGFHIWYLPFQTDIRKLDFSGRENHTDDQKDVDLFAKMIRKLRIKYTPEHFKDPTLNLLHANIVDLAFDIHPQEDIDANSLENFGIDEEHLNNVVASFRDNLQLIEPDPMRETTSTKRKTGKNAEQAAKIPRNDVFTKEQIDQYIENNTLEKLTVKQLKSYLQSNNVSGISSATKPNLINKIKDLHTNN